MIYAVQKLDGVIISYPLFADEFGNEFVPCSYNICDILKRFRSFKTQL